MSIENKPFQEEQQTQDNMQLTPHDIVHKQITNPAYHVTEEDLNRMVVSDHAPEENTPVADTAISGEDTAGTSYDVLGD